MTARERDVDALRRDFDGLVLERGDPGYDQARRVFNAMIDKHPAVIAQVAGVADVARAIRFARAHDLEIAVRGGGHSVAGKALTEGGLVVNLRRLAAVTVNPDAATATVGGGATMRDLDRATQPYGLATTGGRVTTTGVGGLTLGGGSGWLDRAFGLVCDNLVAVELVTAAGEHVRADADAQPELFWALHGGGGNFGVVTSFTFRLRPLTTITAAFLTWAPDHAPAAIGGYRDVLASAPDEVGGAIMFHTAPDAAWVPEHLRGRLACTSLVTYAGAGAAAREAIDPVLRLGHAGHTVVEVPYADLQSMLDDPPDHRNHWSAEYLDALPDAAVELFCFRARDMLTPSPSAQVLVPLGGAVARGPADYPVSWRQAHWHLFPAGMWTDPADDARVRRWSRDLRSDLRPWSSGTVALNFIGDEGPDRVVAALGAENLARLAAVKAVYDPDNVFHLNHNIRPG